MENKEFVDKYIDILKRTANLEKESEEIRQKRDQICNRFREGADMIRLVTIDLTPSERFVTDGIHISEKKNVHQKTDDDGNKVDTPYIDVKLLTTSAVGFGFLRKRIPHIGYYYQPTTTQALGYRDMLGLIADPKKMTNLLMEFIDNNKQKAPKIMKTLITLEEEAKELLALEKGFERHKTTVTLDEPIDIKIFELGGKILDINASKITIGDSRTGIQIQLTAPVDIDEDSYDYDEDDNKGVVKSFREGDIENYPIFAQMIGTLEKSLSQMRDELEQFNAKVLELNKRIEEKTSTYVVMDKLDNSKSLKAGSVSW